ncbi:MAG TPA: DNA recombination protein RmuC [Candidatus Bathyarchaeia archaeon]|nr:DNA recombination protein RmuC [Candidatus Bathyarchaeia archaeon]
MADVVLYILISVACILGLIGIIYQIILHSRKGAEVDTYTKQMQFAVDQTTREMQKFFDMLRLKPSSMGGFGENIVRILLSNLPEKHIKEQYQPRDISGRIDFVIQLPKSDLLIPIDSKFMIPKEFEGNETVELDKLVIDRLNKKAVRRASEITKYIDSVETTDFVLMYVPDFIYGILTTKTFQELASMNVVPTNSSGLLSAIFMINMQYRFTKLNSAAGKFGEIQMKVSQGIRNATEKISTGSIQLQNCMNNISDAFNELTKITTVIETLNIEDYQLD